MTSRDNAAIQQRFGARVRARRKELSLSQEDLGDRVGLHRTYISSLERGKRNVSLCTLVRLASALESEPSVLLDGLDAVQRS